MKENFKENPKFLIHVKVIYIDGSFLRVLIVVIFSLIILKTDSLSIDTYLEISLKVYSVNTELYITLSRENTINF